MQNEPLNSHGDDNDIRTLFEQTAPVATPVDIGELLAPNVDGRFGGSRKPSGPTRALRERKSIRAKRYGLALVGLAAGLLLMFAVTWTLFHPGVVFAQVKSQVEATKSVRYYETRSDDGKDAGAIHAKAVMTELDHRIAKIEDALNDAEGEKKKTLMKEQMQWKEQWAQVQIKLQLKGNAAWKQKVMILGKHLKRTETTDALGDRVMITNTKSGKSISINHADRSVRAFTKQITIDQHSGKRTEGRIAGNASLDLYGDIRDIPDSASKIAETKTIDGKELVGFRATKRVGPDTWTRTFWVDPKTKLPRRIDISYRSTAANHGSVDWRLSDIEFDIPLDKSLFSTELPTGYAVHESGFVSVKPTN